MSQCWQLTESESEFYEDSGALQVSRVYLIPHVLSEYLKHNLYINNHSSETQVQQELEHMYGLVLMGGSQGKQDTIFMNIQTKSSIKVHSLFRHMTWTSANITLFYLLKG